MRETLATFDSGCGGPEEAEPYVKLLFMSLDLQARLLADVEKARPSLGLSSEEALAILWLWKRPSVESDLAQAIGLTRTSANSLVVRLEGLELVARTQRGGDRRVVTVSLTDIGRAVGSKLKESIAPAGRLSPRELTEFSSLLERLRANPYSK